MDPYIAFLAPDDVHNELEVRAVLVVAFSLRVFLRREAAADGNGDEVRYPHRRPATTRPAAALMAAPALWRRQQ